MSNDEKDLYLETLKHLNYKQRRIEELEKKNYITEKSYNNLQDALFVILYFLEKMEGSTVSHDQIIELLSKIKSVSLNGLLDSPIRKYFEGETLKGGIVCQKIVENYLDTDDDNCIDISHYTKEKNFG